jgi:hypothetical protein
MNQPSGAGDPSSNPANQPNPVNKPAPVNKLAPAKPQQAAGIPGANTPAAPNPASVMAAAPSPSPPAPLSGRRVVAAGLVSGCIGLALSFFLRAVVANTPVRVTSLTLLWSTVLLSCIGFGAGMALEAVRQLSENNPDPAYRRGRRGER